jgi:glycosyltransferase involved in cell wall biosynthesis
MEATVAYCSLSGAEAHEDPGFGVKVAWDVPLLEDYLWIQIKNFSRRPAVGKLFGLINPGVWKLIRTGRFDAIAIFTGYVCVTFWIAVMAAKLSGIPLIYGTDATALRPVDGRNWKASAKKYFWPRLFGMADMVVAPSSGTVELMRSLNIPGQRIALMPYVVDNEWWLTNAERVDRTAVRRSLQIPEHASVILFCAKLQPWKRPQDLLRAFARASILGAYLVYAGDGAMRERLEREAADLNVRDRVRFLGFVNQTGLPQVYCSSDLLVLPSEYEPFGLVVNEAMLCGCPVVVSDRVGARFDLVKENETGFVYPVGDVETLGALLIRALQCRDRLKHMGRTAQQKMDQWSPQRYVQSFVDAVQKAIELRVEKIVS